MLLSDENSLSTLCDQFREAFQTGKRPQIADFLPQVAPAVRDELLQRLITCDIECRRQSGEVVRSAEYDCWVAESPGPLRQLLTDLLSNVMPAEPTVIAPQIDEVAETILKPEGNLKADELGGLTGRTV